MADAIKFPEWFGPADGEPIHVRSAHEIQEGWVQHYGHYDVPRGCWVPSEAPKAEEAPEAPAEAPTESEKAPPAPKAARKPRKASKPRKAK